MDELDKYLLQQKLETLIDANGMFHVLSALYSVCTDKAEHVRSYWQDDTGARNWERGAQTLNKAISFPEWPI